MIIHSTKQYIRLLLLFLYIYRKQCSGSLEIQVQDDGKHYTLLSSFCPENTYGDVGGCTPCPIGARSPPFSTNSSACTCDMLTRSVDADKCCTYDNSIQKTSYNGVEGLLFMKYDHCETAKLDLQQDAFMLNTHNTTISVFASSLTNNFNMQIIFGHHTSVNVDDTGISLHLGSVRYYKKIYISRTFQVQLYIRRISDVTCKLSFRFLNTETTVGIGPDILCLSMGNVQLSGYQIHIPMISLHVDDIMFVTYDYSQYKDQECVNCPYGTRKGTVDSCDACVTGVSVDVVATSKWWSSDTTVHDETGSSTGVGVFKCQDSQNSQDTKCMPQCSAEQSSSPYDLCYTDTYYPSWSNQDTSNSRGLYRHSSLQSEGSLRFDSIPPARTDENIMRVCETNIAWVGVWFSRKPMDFCDEDCAREITTQTIDWSYNDYADYKENGIRLWTGVTYTIKYPQAHPFVLHDSEDLSSSTIPNVLENTRNEFANSITFTIPVDYTGDLWYHCQNHRSMPVGRVWYSPRVSCGDGIKVDGEECDDGNLQEGDGCYACRIEGGYACSHNDCLSTCAYTGSVCGDGQVSGTENCDDGNRESGDGCNTLCIIECGYTCVIGSDCETSCGDGITVSLHEECDDANQIEGDGCNINCQTESGFVCTENAQCSASICSMCANGVVDDNEECDDGNRDEGDGCDSSCFLECGNGQRQGAEECDDGNKDEGDGCDSNCFLECGNGQIQGAEECDDGNRDEGDGCDSNCFLECGNGQRQGAEECDDGNRDEGDGCDSNCFLECGNGQRQGAEECDDGNRDEGDGCDSSCFLECGNGQRQGAEECDDGNKDEGDGCDSNCFLECGNGQRQGAEECDDGNTDEGDGCNSSCNVECGFYCILDYSNHTDICMTECGDGQKAGAEECDTNSTVTVGCSNCTVVSGYICTQENCGSSICTKQVCGDGMVGGEETCDDMNQISGDGCSDMCALECGFSCTGILCTTICGDGIVAGYEDCDFDSSEHAGCSSVCTVEEGYMCVNNAQCNLSKCSPMCGDGHRLSSESCDDGNLLSGDGCSEKCTIECGYNCTDSNNTDARHQNSTCRSTCGDGILASDEECDDSNMVNMDGCSDMCTVHQPFVCAGMLCQKSQCVIHTSSNYTAQGSKAILKKWNDTAFTKLISTYFQDYRSNVSDPQKKAQNIQCIVSFGCTLEEFEFQIHYRLRLLLHSTLLLPWYSITITEQNVKSRRLLALESSEITTILIDITTSDESKPSFFRGLFDEIIANPVLIALCAVLLLVFVVACCICVYCCTRTHNKLENTIPAEFSCMYEQHYSPRDYLYI